MATKITPFDAAEYLETEGHIQAYLEAVLEENDPVFFQEALGTVARARGMHGIAGKADITRAGLYKALSSTGNPEFATILRVVNALGYRFTVVPALKKKTRPRAVRQ